MASSFKMWDLEKKLQIKIKRVSAYTVSFFYHRGNSTIWKARSLPRVEAAGAWG